MKEELKQLYLMNVLLKLIIKKIYNLNDTQYKRVIKAFEKDAEKGVEDYLTNLDRREW